MAILETCRCLKNRELIETCPIDRRQIVVTGCFHIFCISCLKEWIQSLEKECPLCRNIIFRKQSGKDFQVIWKIFLTLIDITPETVFQCLDQKSGEKEKCSTCLEDFPPLHIYINEEKTKEITIKDVVDVVKFHSYKYEKLKNKLTPRRANFFDKLLEAARIR